MMPFMLISYMVWNTFPLGYGHLCLDRGYGVQVHIPLEICFRAADFTELGFAPLGSESTQLHSRDPGLAAAVFVTIVRTSARLTRFKVRFSKMTTNCEGRLLMRGPP